MTKKQLEEMVNGIQRPNLIESEVKLLLNKEDTFIKPIPRVQRFPQSYHKEVAQPKPQQVAQPRPQQVAQAVAQVPRVAQVVAKEVAQPKPQQVAQPRPQQVAQPKTQVVAQRVKDSEELLIEKDVNELKDQIFQIQGVDARKKFIKDIGWGVLGEKRGKKYYLFGAKKISGKKYKLYIGNATN